MANAPEKIKDIKNMYLDQMEIREIDPLFHSIFKSDKNTISSIHTPIKGQAHFFRRKINHYDAL